MSTQLWKGCQEPLPRKWCSHWQRRGEQEGALPGAATDLPRRCSHRKTPFARIQFSFVFDASFQRNYYSSGFLSNKPPPPRLTSSQAWCALGFLPAGADLELTHQPSDPGPQAGCCEGPPTVAREVWRCTVANHRAARDGSYSSRMGLHETKYKPQSKNTPLRDGPGSEKC